VVLVVEVVRVVLEDVKGEELVVVVEEVPVVVDGEVLVVVDVEVSVVVEGGVLVVVDVEVSVVVEGVVLVVVVEVVLVVDVVDGVKQLHNTCKYLYVPEQGFENIPFVPYISVLLLGITQLLEE
jgi:hypothetical protein